MKKLICIGFLALGALLPASAQINYENTQRLNDGWKFLRSDLGGIWEAARPDNTCNVPLWEKVTLPHCFNAEDAVDPDVNYYQGPGWYKKQIKIDNPFPKGRTKLHFEGAGQKTDVYIHMTKVGSHVGGYDEWTVDITDAVKNFMASKDAARFKGKVPLNIRCDNSRDLEMIPSDLSDFTLYGGLYRYLNLVYVPETEITSLQTDATVDVQGTTGKLTVKAEIQNHGDDAKEFNATVVILDPNGKIVKKEEKMFPASGRVEVMTLEIDTPMLWSPDAPNLYTCKINGPMNVAERFGFRHFRFEEKGPFYLNGKRLLLRGTHRHEDHAGVAAAMDEATILREMKMMKEMGVNFIRLGHYQQSRIVLDACDRLGIIVWEEIPWCRGGLGGDVYKEQARRMLKNMIEQHRNHPSIILWGMGNENDWPGDFTSFDKKKIQAFMKELHDLSHELDPTRVTCIRRCEFCSQIVDVYSPSIWAGWYRGIYTDYKQVSEAEMKKVKHFLHVEWGGDGHAGRHAEASYIKFPDIKPGEADGRAGDALMTGGQPRVSKDGSWSETYICDLVDWHLKEQETMPWLTGAAYWPFKDFATPLRPENPVPYVNQKGVVERDLTPKNVYYVFQSYWIDTPMAHIYGHNWPIRWGSEDEAKTVKVYSNCETVELFVNGTSMGVKTRNSQNFPAAGLRWNVKFKSGKNEMKAIGTKGGVKTEDVVEFTYETRKWGRESKVELTTNDAGKDGTWINAQIVDKDGVPCLESNTYIEFDALGGTLLQNQGTSSGSRKLQTYNGRARILLKPSEKSAVVSVKAEKLPMAYITVGETQ